MADSVRNPSHRPIGLDQQECEPAAPLYSEREQHYRALYDHNPSMYFTLSAEGTVLSVNRYGAEMLGYEPEGLVGQSVLAVFQPQDHGAVLEQIALCTGNPGQLFEWELQKIRKDGSALWVKERAQAIRAPSGCALVLVVCEDVTTRRLSEEIIRESEERWRALFEHAAVGIAQLSMGGQFLRVNPRLCETLGYSAKTLLQRSLQELAHPDDGGSGLQERWNRLRAGSHPSFFVEQRFRRSDDAWIWVNLTVSIVRTASSSPAYFIAVIEDVSERKRSVEALRESEQAIRSLQEATSTPGRSFDQRLLTVLELGRRRFKLPVGILTKIQDEQLELTHVSGDDGRLTPGMRFPVRQAPCHDTLQTTEVVCLEEADASGRLVRPAYRGLGFECYLGTRLPGLRRIHGTMCFLGQAISHRRFSEADKDFLLLMARWVGGELDRRDSEQALKEQESLLRSVIDTAIDSIFVKDKEGRYRFINAAGAAILGTSSDEVVGRTDRELFPPDTAGKQMEDDWAVFSGAIARQFEAVIPVGGSDRTFHSIKTPHRDQQGRVIGLVGVSRDMTDVKRAEETLRMTQFAVDHAADMVYWISRDARLIYANDAASERLGYTKDELCRMKVSDIDLNYHADVWEAHWEELKARKRLRFESRNRTKSGEIYPIEVVANYVEFQGVEYNFAFARDITDRKRSFSLLEAAMNSVDDGLLVVDLQGRITGMNNRFLQLWKIPADLAQSRNDPELLASVFNQLRDPEAFRQRIQDLYAHPEQESFDVLQFADGRVFERHSRPQILDQTIVGRVWSFRDITDRKRSEAALEASEAQLQRFVSEAPVGLVILDKDRRVLTANKAFCRLTGYDQQELAGCTYELYTHPDDLQRDLALTDEFYRRVRPGYDIEKRYVRKSGEIIWVSVKATSVELPHHPGPLLLAVVQDITDQRRGTEERERLSQDLHDNILQSLYAVGMQLEASRLATGKSARKAKLYAGQAIEHLNHLVGDVRDFIALLKQGGSHHMDVGGALHQLVSVFSTAGHHPPRLTVQEGVLNLISTEQAEQLLNIAREALSNSMRHARATDCAIDIHRMRRTVRLRISDNGVGFVPRLKRKQGHGLVNMSARAKKIGARFRLISKPNGGTSVIVDFTIAHTA